MDAVVLLYEGVAMQDACLAYTAFHHAGQEVGFVADEGVVVTREGGRLMPQRLGFDRVARASAVVVPDGAIRGLTSRADAIAALRARRGRPLLASGDGVLAAAAIDQTSGRRIARAVGAAPVPDTTPVASRLVADGRLYTCLPGDAVADLVLHYLVAQDLEDEARKAAERMGRAWATFALGGRGR